MKLSIIIVNYNVKFFLEQCLHAVYKAIANINAEVFVVDNNSVDGSCLMLNEKFPNIILIKNKENVGFSKANNQAIKKAKGEYVLLLNPDTVVEEKTFEKIIEFMDATPDAGGLGVKMIDGKGTFLPESKRGLPTPSVAFYKIFGLSKLFPKSKKFSKYHLGYLDKDETHSVEILSGAFMMMRKKVLEKIGLLDESFFMYGEDIDLSYRIILAGYKNYYYPHTTIIHYKGESTKKGSINYVRIFYQAMIIFAKKHFAKKNAQFFSFFINIAIYFRAFLAIMNRIVKAIFLPLTDALVLFFGFWLIVPKWENIKFSEEAHFPDEYFFVVIPSYIFIWIVSIYLSGGYDKHTKPLNPTKGIAIGVLFILIIYALLPENLRFSRAIILFSTAWALLSVNLFRSLLHFSGLSAYKFNVGKKKRIAIIASYEKEKHILDILDQSIEKYEYLGLINTEKGDKEKFIGNLSQLKDIIEINKINEIIFCASSLPAEQIIKQMLTMEKYSVSYKIAPPESLSIIGSNSIDTAGELYSVDLNNITLPQNVRAKRLFDICFSLLLIVFLPLFLFIVPQRLSLLRNIIFVLFGFRTWVGFFKNEKINTTYLPTIKKGIVSAVEAQKKQDERIEIIEKINLMYAKDFSLNIELIICIKCYKNLGNRK